MTDPTHQKAEQMLLDSFRLCALNCGDQAGLERRLSAFFGAQATVLYANILLLTRLMAWYGRRRLRLFRPLHETRSADEASLIAALSSQLHGFGDRSALHMQWLLAGPLPSPVMGLLSEIAEGIQLAGLALPLSTGDQDFSRAAPTAPASPTLMARAALIPVG